MAHRSDLGVGGGGWGEHKACKNALVGSADLRYAQVSHVLVFKMTIKPLQRRLQESGPVLD